MRSAPQTHEGPFDLVSIRTRLINRRYRLERRIALSDTTETWLGFDNVLHRAVAVTLPRPELLRDGAFLAEFLQRSRIATALHHRGIVAAFDSGEDGDTPYLVTEYLGGDALTEIIRTESPFDVDDVAILIEQVAAALDYAHQRGFIHGDLNSDEVIVDSQGAAKLLGLGLPIGSMPGRHATSTHGAVTVDDDIAALGAIAFEMLTGEEPTAIGTDSAGEAYLISPDLPRNASDVVAVALGSGSVRFTTAGAFARSLSGWRSFDPGEFYFAPDVSTDWLQEEERSSRNSFPMSYSDSELISLADQRIGSTPEPLPVASRRNRWLFVAALALMVAAGFIVWHSSEPATGVTPSLPARIEILAQLTGF